MNAFRVIKMNVFVMLLGLALFVGLGSAHAESKEDRNARLVLAQEFYKIRPVSEIANKAIESLAAIKPASEQALFMQQLRVNMDYAQLEADLIEALLATFTGEEIKAMNAFYGSDIGKDIQAKQGDFEKALVPILQKMLDKAFAEANYGKNGLQSRP